MISEDDLDTVRRGLINGFKTLWILSRILVPVYFLVTLIGKTPILAWISTLFRPLMFIFGLPGEAAIVLVLGNVLNLYAAIGAMVSIDFTVKQLTILAVMLSFSHSMIVETAIFKRLKVSAWRVVTFRISLAVVSGIMLNLLWVEGV
ncbi:MAG: nucleoside recognition protein [Clostridia bacterium]|nr:nucleoside recognition protein [Clostridia bacterium]